MFPWASNQKNLIIKIRFTKKTYKIVMESNNFTLESNDLLGQIKEEQIFDDNGCNGDNLSPHLKWKHVPHGTESFVVTIHDPDAPTPSGWWHWCVFDIPGSVTELPAGEVDSSYKQTLNDFGKKGFGGACPPEGDREHAYICTVYALNTESLGLEEDSSPAMVCFILDNYLLAKASLISYFKR